MPSCAAWLSWKCQVAPGTAREQVRVARSLDSLPVITGEFAAGRLSYAKVRALTRIAAPDTDADLAEMAMPMTAGQLERFARAHRRVTREQDGEARARRRLTWGWVDDHEFAFRGLLPAEQAGVVLQALRAARGDLEHPHDEEDHDVSAETRPPISHPAYLGCCHMEAGPAISPQALRRAVRERDRCRCRFPGCESRRVDVHHIVYWANGGKTRLENLICLCKRHHHLVHDKDLIIAAVPSGFDFHTKDGTPLRASPPLPPPVGDITNCHNAAITPTTIIPPNSGERLDMHMAIWVAFTNARLKAERRQREQQADAQAA